jgi:Domain of unknown function (DUF4258)
VTWPDWWKWELELSPHLEERMADRNFNEVDLRAILERAEAFSPDVVEGRFIIRTKHRRRPWEVIVEPNSIERRLIVVTAYPVYGD